MGTCVPTRSLGRSALPASNQLLLQLFGIPARLEVLETAQLIYNIAHLAEIDFLALDFDHDTHLKLIADLALHVFHDPAEVDNVPSCVGDLHSFLRLGVSYNVTYLACKTAAQIDIAKGPNSALAAVERQHDRTR